MTAILIDFVFATSLCCDENDSRNQNKIKDFSLAAQAEMTTERDAFKKVIMKARRFEVEIICL